MAVRRWRFALASVVLGHLAVAIVHGAAHQGARVALSPAGNLFVALVVVGGPLVGLLWAGTTGLTAGPYLVAATMAGALVFGVYNHFLAESPDHVARVAEPWRATFATTAVLLAVLEASGTVIGAGMALAVRGRPS